MHRKKREYKRYQVPMLDFPRQYIFRPHGEKQLICNGRTVQVIPSQTVLPEDNPPVDFPVLGLAVLSFEMTDADVYIFSLIEYESIILVCITFFNSFCNAKFACFT